MIQRQIYTCIEYKWQRLPHIQPDGMCDLQTQIASSQHCESAREVALFINDR